MNIRFETPLQVAARHLADAEAEVMRQTRTAIATIGSPTARRQSLLALRLAYAALHRVNAAHVAIAREAGR